MDWLEYAAEELRALEEFNESIREEVAYNEYFDNKDDEKNTECAGPLTLKDVGMSARDFF